MFLFLFFLGDEVASVIDRPEFSYYNSRAGFVCDARTSPRTGAAITRRSSQIYMIDLAGGATNATQIILYALSCGISFVGLMHAGCHIALKLRQSTRTAVGEEKGGEVLIC